MTLFGKLIVFLDFFKFSTKNSKKDKIMFKKITSKVKMVPYHFSPKSFDSSVIRLHIIRSQNHLISYSFNSRRILPIILIIQGRPVL